MEVISGIGDFVVTIARAEARGDKLVLIGRMAAYEPGAQSPSLLWDAEMRTDGPEFVALLATSARPRVAWWVLCAVVRAMAHAVTAPFRRDK